MDYEAGFFSNDYDNTQIYEMQPLLGYVETSLCVPPHPSEPEHIKDLKTRPFLSKVCVFGYSL